MSPDNKQTATNTKTNDSPAFRLRPRAEPKSYYAIRLEYSANPAAFTRERPRSSAKRRSVSSSHKSSYSRSRNQNAGGGNSRTASSKQSLLNNRFPPGNEVNSKNLSHVVTKEELERAEKRRRLQREIAQSVTTDTPISPFIQRIELNDLTFNCVYPHRYVSLRVEAVTVRDRFNVAAGEVNNNSESDQRCLICRCCGIDSDIDPQPPIRPSQLYVDVLLFGHYANDALIRVNKIINIGKFKTGSIQGVRYEEKDELEKKSIGFDIIVDTSCVKPQNPELADSFQPFIPFVSVTDMIEEPLEPFVETAPSPDLKNAESDDGKPSSEVNVSAGALSAPKSMKIELEEVIVDHKKPRLSTDSLTSSTNKRTTP